MTRADRSGGVEGTTPEEQPEPGKLKVVLGCLAGIVTLAIPVALYLGLVTLMGIRGDPSVGTLPLVVGAVLSIVVTGVISLVGESLIEDVVKFVLIGGVFLGVAMGENPLIGALTLGVTVGTFMPLLLRIWTPFLERLGVDGD